MKAMKKVLYDTPTNKSFLKDFSYDDAPEFLDSLLNHAYVNTCIVNDTYLLCYVISEPWYTTKKYLQECLVLRVYRKPIPFGYVAAAMNELAKNNDCIGIYVATDLFPDDKLLSEKYQEYGFKEESIKLFKHTEV